MNSRIFTYFEIIVFKGAVKKGKREFHYFKKSSIPVSSPIVYYSVNLSGGKHCSIKIKSDFYSINFINY